MLLESEGELMANASVGGMNCSIMVVESSHVDREFEKHVLNKEE